MHKFLNRKNWPTLATALLLAATVWQLRQQGRIWFCDCQQPRFWTSEADGPHTSQHLADPYTFSHLQHGLVLFWLLSWAAKKCGAQVKWQWRLVIALAIEAGWEVFENTQFVIDRYREGTAALGYNGDSITNSVGDLLACGLGFYLAHRLGWRGTWRLFWVIEVGMLLTIRDSLLLNVLMLVWPIDTLRQWQMG